MGVQKARSSLDDADSRIESLDLVDSSGIAGNNSYNLEAKVGWVEISSEGVWYTLLFASSNGQPVFSARQIADNPRVCGSSLGHLVQGHQGTSNNGNLNSFLLIVGEVEHRTCRVTIDDLDAKDFSVRELGVDRDIESWCRCWELDLANN